MPPTPRSTAFNQPLNKLGISPAAATNRTQASASPPVATADTSRSDVFTYVTKNDGATYVLYNGDRRWAQLTLNLTSAGPAVVGTRDNLGSIAGGNNIQLQTNVPQRFIIAQGTRLFVAASAVSTISVQVEPIPWLEEIASAIRMVIAALAR